MANKSLHQNYIFDIKKFLSFNNNNYSEESINNIIDKDFIQYDINCDRIRYNPRVQPNWLLNEEIVDNHYFFGIGSVDSGLYLI